MFNVSCQLCHEYIVCKDGDMDILKKHIKVEHEVAKYKLGLILAVCFTSVEEQDHLIDVVNIRIENFTKNGVFDTEDNLFQNDVSEIQRILNADISDDEDDGIETPTNTINVENEEISDRNVPPEETSTSEEIVMISPDDYDETSDDEIEVVFDNKITKVTQTNGLGNKIKVEIETIKVEIDQIKVKDEPKSSNSVLNVNEVFPKVQRPEEVNENDNDKDKDHEEQEEPEEDNPSTLFCRLCYSSFSSFSSKLPHEQIVHNNKEDQDALNMNFAELEVEDFYTFL